ncbi:MAG: hypothetical protein V1836_04415 [Candidatus Aenigmatarchaeota archaeon]
MATFAEAVRLIRTRRILTQMAHSTESMKYRLELSKKVSSLPIALPAWLFTDE